VVRSDAVGQKPATDEKSVDRGLGSEAGRGLDRGTGRRSVKKLLKLVVLAGAAAAVVNALPDIARYLKLKEM
jgi:hypothetical protein